MKSIGTLKEAAFQKLLPVFGTREANSIIRILQEDLFDDNSDEFDDSQALIWHEAVDRVLDHEPISYITGVHYFLNLKLKIKPGVLVPRPETEELVITITDYLKTKESHELNILDIGTGSGCIALAIKSKQHNANLHTIDISTEALSIARENATMLGLELNFIHQDFLEESLWPLLPTDLNILVSNPPYVQSSESNLMTASTVMFEPQVALFTGEDPLIFYKKIAKFGVHHLKSGGWIFVELNEYLSQETKALFTSGGYVAIRVLKDLSQKERILVCQKK